MSLCISPWQLEKGIARHIQELSSSNDTGEPEDVSTCPGPSWIIFFGQLRIMLPYLVEAPSPFPISPCITPGVQDTPAMGLRPPCVLFDAHVGSRTRAGTVCPCGREPLWTPLHCWLQPAVRCPSPHSALLGTVPLCPAQHPSPLTAGHHPAHEVPGVGAAVSQ